MPDFTEDKQLLYSIFGLCPDYQIVFTEEDYCEIYESPRTTSWWVRTFDYHKPKFEEEVDSIVYPDAYRLHLDKHTVELHNGSSVTANFAVSHANKMIFLKVSKVGVIANLVKYE